MKIVTAVLALFVVLSVPTSAQTSSSNQTVLQIKRFLWVAKVGTTLTAEDGPMPRVALDSRLRQGSSLGDFHAYARFKNVGHKPIKLIKVDVTFRDTVTDQEFLTYQFRFDRMLGPGQTKELSHRIRKDLEQDNFRPAAPDYDLRRRTAWCVFTAEFFDAKTKKIMKRRDDAYTMRYSDCYYLPTVTRIEYADGSVWEP